MEQQLINQVYKKSMFWSRYYEESDLNLSFEFDAVMQCLMFSQTVHKLDYEYSEEVKEKYLKEATKYINYIKKDYPSCKGTKDMSSLFSRYLKEFN